MARLLPANAATLITDEHGRPVPVLPFVSAHNLAPDEATAARNSTAIGAASGFVLLFCDVRARFAVGDNTVVATATDFILPAGQFLPVPLYEGDDYVSVLRDDGGTGATVAQIVETA